MAVDTIDGASVTGSLRTAPGEPADGRPTILVVDDRAINRDFLVTLLNYSGYQTVEASSPSALPSVDHLDLIITDVHMPGVNGLDFLASLRADPATRRVPVILYTATYKSLDVESKAKALGAFAILTKPTAPEIILEKVRAALHSNLQGRKPASPEMEPTSSVTAPAAPLPLNLGYRSATLIEIMLDLAAERDAQELIKTFCHGAKELINVREAGVHIAVPAEDESQSHLFFSTSTGSNPSDSLPLPNCNCGLVGLAKKAEGRCLRSLEAAALGIVLPPQACGSAVLYVPIATSENQIGCLCLTDKVSGEAFTAEDERLIITLATELALVYENIRLYQKVERFAVRLARESEDRKRAQKELDLSRLEQVRLKDEFLSHVSHELRSPVMVLHQFLEILLEGLGGEVNEQQRGYLDVALRNTIQLNSMISDLLEATRIETGKLRVDLQSMPLPDVLNEAMASSRPAAEHKHIALSLQLPASLSLVMADRGRVRQIVSNFLENALKFTPENGAITIQAGADEADSSFVRIQVTDTGCGISPDDAGKIFDRLYQVPNADSAARKGLGLGLCICKQLVKLQGGTIQVKSHPGAGSVFSFTLPVFSMANLVTPILRKDPLPESMVLLTIEVRDQDGLNSSNLSASLRETIGRCVLPDLDVVLPGAYSCRNGRMFVVLARTDDRGARVLARRLEDQLKLNQQAANLTVPPLVQFSIIDVSIAGENLDLDGQRAAVAVRIEQNLKAIIAEKN